MWRSLEMWRWQDTVGRGMANAPSLPVFPDHLSPSNDYLITYLVALSVLLVSTTVMFKQQRRPKDVLVTLGVSLRRVAKTVREIERKTFHICGLLVPIIHQSLLRSGWR